MCIKHAQNCSLSKKAVDQTCAVARLRKVRQAYITDIPRAVLADSLALGYKYVAPPGLSVSGFGNPRCRGLVRLRPAPTRPRRS
jgi:hypothetical protein